jgi:hypothetical protein
MAGDALINLSEVINSLPPYVVERFDNLVVILQAVGIAFIIYVIYVIVKMFLGFKSARRLRLLIKKVDSLERKIDLLIKVKKKKRKKEKK